MSVSPDKMIDYIYDLVNEALVEEWWQFVDDLLVANQLIVRYTDTDILLALLTSTMPAKSKLPRRHEFVDAVRETFQKHHPNEWQELLQGLE
jgi:hypothetical protein